jgi:hypothetical protein
MQEEVLTIIGCSGTNEEYTVLQKRLRNCKSAIHLYGRACARDSGIYSHSDTALMAAIWC